MSIKRRANTLDFNYSMDSTPLIRTNTMNDLGVLINSTLRWNDQVDTVITKTKQRLWMLIRTLGYDAPFKIKLTTYLTIVRSIEEYNTVVWCPSDKENIKLLESIQRKATNYITNNPKRPAPTHIEYKERLIACKLLPLSFRREIYDLVFFIKSIRGMLSFNILDHISFTFDPVNRVTRNRALGLNLSASITKQEATAHFYPSRIARLWNSLPAELRLKLKSPISLYHVKSLLNAHYTERLTNIFETDNTCTWVSVCRCGQCRPQ